jgi:hypothetical protein
MLGSRTQLIRKNTLPTWRTHPIHRQEGVQANSAQALFSCQEFTGSRWKANVTSPPSSSRRSHYQRWIWMEKKMLVHGGRQGQRREFGVPRVRTEATSLVRRTVTFRWPMETRLHLGRLTRHAHKKSSLQRTHMTEANQQYGYVHHACAMDSLDKIATEHTCVFLADTTTHVGRLCP